MDEKRFEMLDKEVSALTILCSEIIDTLMKLHYEIESINKKSDKYYENLNLKIEILEKEIHLINLLQSKKG